jgi:AcrR family transcriptional regulator
VARNGAPDKRRIILDAAVRVFARQGFHTCRVSDIADEAQVAYGLVYHYFGSKDEVLDTLFVERWDILLEAIRETDATDIPAREKLYAIASFIVDSYRHDPELMKVIIVEVTRAANSFGRTHLPKIGEAYGLIAEIVRKAQADGSFRDSVTPEFARWRSTERSSRSDRLDLRPARAGGRRLRARQVVRRGHHLRRPRGARVGTVCLTPATMTDNDMVKRLMWSGLLAGLGSLATIATTRIAHLIWVRAFGEDPPE